MAGQEATSTTISNNDLAKAISVDRDTRPAKKVQIQEPAYSLKKPKSNRWLVADDKVYVRPHPDADWEPGVIQKCLGHMAFEVKLEDGRVLKKHKNQMRIRYFDDPKSDADFDDVLTPIKTKQPHPILRRPMMATPAPVKIADLSDDDDIFIDAAENFQEAKDEADQVIPPLRCSRRLATKPRINYKEIDP
uniref:Uncharacterized protein n=1 Tax=Acrobeloides nanus TaxID=290746 RepID=A0A914E048_9BILA